MTVDTVADSTSCRAGASPTSTSRSTRASSAPPSSRLRADVDRDRRGRSTTTGSAPSSRARPPPPTARAADEAIAALNDARRAARPSSRSYVYATVSTDSRDERAQSLFSRGAQPIDARAHAAARPARRLGARAARRRDGPTRWPSHSAAAAEHAGPLLRLAARADHQMSEAEEGLYAELATIGSTAWANLHRDVTSQLSVDVELPDGHAERLPMPAVRGLANDGDPAVRRAAYDAEMAAWPQVAVPCAAAMNAIKGEANDRQPAPQVGRPARRLAVRQRRQPRRRSTRCRRPCADSLGDFRRWMRAKAALHGATPARACRGGTSSPRCPVAPATLTLGRGRGDRPRRVRRRTAPSSAASSTAPSTSGGSTPARATARPAARSACRSSATARSCC